MRYPIEKNSIQETLVIPLYGRALCSRKFPHLFADQTAAELLEQIDYDVSALEQRSGGLMQTFGALEAAMRQSDLAFEVREYLRAHPRAAVVNLGCGLDSTGRSCDNGQCRIYNIDLPDVMVVREALLPAEEREKNLAADLNDFSWFDTPAEDGAVFFAAGVFYYFQTEQVRALCAAMAERFPDGQLVFDAAGPAAVKLMLKTWVRQAGIRDVGAYFSVRDAGKELTVWSDRISVSSRGYMLGYQDLRGPGIRNIHRLLAGIADGPMRRADEAANRADGVSSQKRGEFLMNEPFIFRVSDCYYIQASYPSPAEHRHFAAHLVFAMERPFTALVNGVSVEAAGIAIGSDVPHTILSEAPTLVVFIDELTPMSRCVKHTLLRGAPWRTLDTSVSSEVGERWRDVRTEADAAAAAAETERLLGLQEQRTSAEDPRILEAAAYMKATPALEQLTIREVARAVHLSPSRLTHLFRRDTGISVVRYVHDRGEADFPGRPGPDQNSR